MVLPAEMERAHGGRGRYLVPSDRVVGVVIAGETRAYPERVLQWFEIVNDEIAGVPLAVTLNPLCDSAMVFDRRVGEETLRFGVSGLLYNSNLLMYDRRADAVGESLWSQLGARAVAGPAAGTPLRVLPAALAAWADWLNAHPSTSVIERDPRLLKRYKGTKYGQYFRSEKLMFPVAPAPPPDGPAVKQRIVAVEADGVRAAWPISRIAEQADPSGTWRTTVGSRRLRLHVRPETETVIVTAEPADPPIAVYYAFWFAWHAIVERG